MLHNKKIENQEVFIDMEDEDYEDRQLINVAVYEDKAYWVVDNVFYEADLTREPDFTTARPIDTMNLPPKKLNELLNILDELQDNRRD